MNKTLAERFAAAKGAPIDFEGQLVFSLYRHEVNQGQTFSLRFVHHVDNPIQGLRLKLAGGMLYVNGQSLEDVVLWVDTAPPEIEVTCLFPQGTDIGELRIWNCWRSDSGTVQAWTGNAGIVVVEKDNEVTLQCSSGSGLFDSAQLKAAIQFHY